VRLRLWRFELRLAHRWAISSIAGPGGGGTQTYSVVFVELTDADGTVGIGEAAPSVRYEENADSTVAFLEHVSAPRLSFSDIPGSMAYLETVASGNHAPKAAVNIALLDGAARRAGKPVHDLLGLGFAEGRHVTSFSIGLDSPEVIRQKVAAAEAYPILKLKVGGPDDRKNLAALRDVAPRKLVRVDANEAWRTKEEALSNLEWLAADGHVQFAEQPMPASTAHRDMAWLKARSPLPLMGDESYLSPSDAARCAEAFHSVNVKLVKTGGITGGHAALLAARKAGLKTMLGCMIESSVLITAAAHLAELTDFLDIDGNLLITNDPYVGSACEAGVISLARAPLRTGLCVAVRASAS
jgi:L-alanine-DL-glutamate epimerase-like enolase superfamily enzyme